MLTPDTTDAPDDFATEVRRRLEGITSKILDHVEQVIDHGSPKQKSDLIRQVFPVLARALSPEESNQELDNLREMQAELMAKLAE